MAQEARAAAARPVDEAAIELKGTVAPLTVIRLRTAVTAAIESELRGRVEQAPRMLLHAPVVVDASALEGATLDLEELVAALRRCGVVPVGLANADENLAPRAARAGLGNLELGAGRGRRAAAAPAAPIEIEAPAPAPAAVAPTMMLRNPVRAGQVVYARRADLVVLAAVNPGAQVIADGHIHVYGPLRGRALAGAGGNIEARIFCRELDAELVSIAGEYLMADDIPEGLRGRPGQVYLKDERCCLAPL